MQALKMAFVLMSGVVVLFEIFPSGGLCDDKSTPATFYEACIVREIVACQSKASLLNSRSDNLREYAQAKLQKATFLAGQKDSLVEELLKKQIALKGHRIQVYLNSRFYNQMD
jgi:hypothetical protein